jgi:ABC-type glycerol-3-phosphate transport system substrate-binding protein
VLSGEQAADAALAEAQDRAEAEILDAASGTAGATPVPTFVVAPAEEEPEVEGGVSITFVPGLGSFNLDPYRGLAEQFHEEHPDVVVEVKTLDFATGAPNLKQMAAGSDCFEWFPSFWDPENREAILNLEPMADADPAFDADDYYPSVLEQFTWQGQLWGLPADITPFVLEYNKELFSAAGLQEPSPDWTWDGFLETAVALTEGEGEEKQYGFVAQVYELNDLLLISERLGAQLLDLSADPPGYSFDHPDTVKAVRWYANLTTEHGVKPVFLTDLRNLLGASSAVMERQGLIDGGRAGMWTGATDSIILYGLRRDPNVGAVPLPARADGEGAGSYLGASGYFISADTQSREACWQWITFLNNQPGTVLGLPARRSLAESDAFRAQVGADRADAYLAAIGDAEQPSAFQIFSQEEWLGNALLWLGQAYGRIVEGDASVEDALAEAQMQAEEYRACLITKDDFSGDAAEACAKEVDPTLPDFLFATGE